MGSLPHRAQHLIVTFMPNEDNGVTLAGEADSLQMDLGDQGASGVNGSKTALGRNAAHLRRHAMSAIEQCGPMRNLAHMIHKDDASLTKLLHDGPIVHDLVIDVYGCAE